MLERIAEELRELGLAPAIVKFPSFGASQGAVVLNVKVDHGRYKGQTLTVGLSFQENAYPEYPPHFVHFKTTVKTNITRHSVHDFQGESWAAYSLPPSDFWDRLNVSQKTMKTFVRRHLTRVLAQL